MYFLSLIIFYRIMTTNLSYHIAICDIFLTFHLTSTLLQHMRRILSFEKNVISFDVYLSRSSVAELQQNGSETISNYECVADKRNILWVFIRFLEHLASQSCLSTTHFTFRMSDSLCVFELSFCLFPNEICL